MVYKRGILFLLALLTFVSCVKAAHIPTVSVSYNPIYETTATNISLTISNSILSQHKIENVDIITNNFTILGSFELIGWFPTLISEKEILYITNTSKISNWGSQTFGLEVKASKVEENTTVQWVIITKDTNNEIQQKDVSLMIINDESPPTLSNILPQNNSFIKEGTKQTFSIDATDPETEISSVFLDYGLCGNITHHTQLQKINDTYFSLEDLSTYVNENILCYTFTAKNNGGESSSFSGVVTIDGTPPYLSLISPPQGAVMNSNSEFRFIAYDNLAPIVTCKLYIDGLEGGNITTKNGEETAISANESPEGTHNWSINCSDFVGLSNISETRQFIMDKTLPVITIKSPSSNSVNKAGIPVVVEVTDNYGIDKVQYSYQGLTYDVDANFSINTENATDGINTIIITAIDKAGNRAILEYNLTIDRAPPSIEILAPNEGSTVDVHVPYTFVTTDNYDNNLYCEIYVDGTIIANGTALSGEETLIIGLTEPGNKSYSIKCIDDADNSATTLPIMINVEDFSGPDIKIKDIPTLTRGNDIEVEAVITDYSGVESVDAVIKDSEGNSYDIDLKKNADTYKGIYKTTKQSPVGKYTLRITATDGIFNTNSVEEEFFVVYSYSITLNVPKQVRINEKVSISGSLLLDNGSLTNQRDINMMLPTVNITAPLDNNGSFAYSFNAPSKTGKYNISVWSVSEQNITYSLTKTLDVITSPRGSGGKVGSSGGGGGHSSAIMSGAGGNSGILEQTENLSEEIKEVIVNVPNQNAESENSGVLEKQEAEENYGRINIPEKNNKDNNQKGIGKATSFISRFEQINISAFFWVLVLVLSVALLLKLLSKGGKGKDRFSEDLDSYIRKIRKKGYA
ncbi:MAG: hypothetical protein QXG86_00935 [Candidatus Woesearchaeota archaeon]